MSISVYCLLLSAIMFELIGIAITYLYLRDLFRRIKARLKRMFPEKKPSAPPVKETWLDEKREENTQTDERATPLKKRTLLIDYADKFGVGTTREIRTMSHLKLAGLLAAYCLLRHETRTFRIDRILSATDVKTKQEITNLPAYLATIERQ